MPVARCPGKLDALRCELEAENPGMGIPMEVRWILSPERMEERQLNGRAIQGAVGVAVRGRQMMESILVSRHRPTSLVG